MKKLVCLALFLIGTGTMIKAQFTTDEELFRDAIKTLASDEFGGRQPL